MPGELGAKDLAGTRYQLPELRFNPLDPSSYFSRAIPNIVTDTSKLSKAQGFKSIMEALGQLPEKGMKLYAEAKKVNTDLETRREYDKALKDPESKDPSHAPLSDFKVASGAVTLDREDPSIHEMKKEEAKARTAYWKARAAGHDTETEANPLFGGEPDPHKDAMLDYDEKKPTTGNPIIDSLYRDVKKGGTRKESCWDWAQCVYNDAGAGEGEVIFDRHPSHEPVGELDFGKVTPGDWLWVNNGNKVDKDGEHSVIFMDWLDKEKGLARVASGSSGREPRIETYDFNKKPVVRIAKPQYVGKAPEPGGLRKTIDPDADPGAASTLAGASAGIKPVIDGATVVEDNQIFRIEEKESNGFITTYKIPKRLPKGSKGKLADYIQTSRVKKEAADKPTATENAVDRRIIALGGNPEGMTPDEKTEYLAKTPPLKPSERIATMNQMKSAYHEMPSTIALFGTKESVGLDTVKTKLDSLLGAVGGDFSKLSPTDQKTFVFNFSKFNDPGSAVLIQEYKAAADTLGILDQAGLALEKAKNGEQITPEQAQMLYKTINTVYDRMKSEYVQEVAAIIEDAKESNIPLHRIGLPKKAEQWVKEALSEAPDGDGAPASRNRSVPSSSSVKPAAAAAPVTTPVAAPAKATNPIAALQAALQSGKNPDGTPMSDEDRRAIQAALKLKSATQ